jgi:mono/diheme cytochrome c family protein
MIRTVIIAAGMSLVLSLATASLRGQAPQATTNDGVYTAAQAERGQKTFADKCTACHEPARFTGDTFLDVWAGKPLKEVWDIASGTMPEDNPGSLKPQEYGDILAYFLQLNTFPAGAAELKGSAAAMANIQIEKPKKP